MDQKSNLVLCPCGCGRYAPDGESYVPGHKILSAKEIEILMSFYHIECYIKPKKVKIKPKKVKIKPKKVKIIHDPISRLKEKKPLPTGVEIQIPSNKNCASYLGSIAEELLAKTYKNVKRMPFGNHGYDIICDKNYKIDVKSSALGYKGYWIFIIRKNTIPDFFLCVGFESRKELAPTHLWLIPGDIVNHKAGIRISKSTTYKWTKYEQSIDRVLKCCNVMKS